MAFTITWPQPNWDGWDQLDCRVKEKQPTSAQHMWEILQDYWKIIPHEDGWENAKSVQICHQGKGWLRTLKNLKYKIHLDLFNTFLVTTWLHMCYFIVLMSSLLFYNVGNSKIKKNPRMSRCVQTFDWYCIYCTFTHAAQSRRFKKTHLLFTEVEHVWAWVSVSSCWWNSDNQRIFRKILNPPFVLSEAIPRNFSCQTYHISQHLSWN